MHNDTLHKKRKKTKTEFFFKPAMSLLLISAAKKSGKKWSVFVAVSQYFQS